MARRQFVFRKDAKGARRLVELEPRASQAPSASPSRPTAAPASPPPTPGSVARRRLYDACLEQGGPTFDQADEMARELGVADATRLVRRHGASAPEAAFSEAFWRERGA